MIKFKKVPLCEVCGKGHAISFSFFHQENQTDIEKEHSLGSVLTGKSLIDAINNIDNPVVKKKNDDDRKELKKDFVLHNKSGVCKFVCGCTADTEFYYIYIHKFFKEPSSTIDWIAHMHEKNWFDEYDFFEMMSRFRTATNSYGTL